MGLGIERPFYNYFMENIYTFQQDEKIEEEQIKEFTYRIWLRQVIVIV